MRVDFFQWNGSSCEGRRGGGVPALLMLACLRRLRSRHVAWEVLWARVHWEIVWFLRRSLMALRLVDVIRHGDDITLADQMYFRNMVSFMKTSCLPL